MKFSRQDDTIFTDTNFCRRHCTYLSEKLKCWLNKGKKYVILGGTAALTIIGAGYLFYKNDEISFSDWFKMASKEELDEIYEKEQSSFSKTGIKSSIMEQVGYELEERGSNEWFDKHPPNKDPNFRWTDAARWDKD